MTDELEAIRQELLDVKRLLILQLLKEEVPQEKIAKALGITQPTISKFISPKRSKGKRG